MIHGHNKIQLLFNDHHKMNGQASIYSASVFSCVCPLHTYTHEHIHTYIHTYRHTYVRTHTSPGSFPSNDEVGPTLIDPLDVGGKRCTPTRIPATLRLEYSPYLDLGGRGQK